ncbi:hypothetical protein R4P64_16370 [Rhodococcus sp. IEGM 1366]|nr:MULTISPECIES: hypothetical protein [unclassified Rhodococcus (in: high G+C Gram-positive bacteria)]MDV8068089.1 hypothetical protein [Rhodococcus sp. IEGM 1366]
MQIRSRFGLRELIPLYVVPSLYTSDLNAAPRPLALPAISSESSCFFSLL